MIHTDIWGFADKYLRPYKVKGNEITPELCPICHGGDHKDKYSFALNDENGTFNCKRGSCGKQGNFWQLCKDFNEQSDRQEVDNTYRAKIYKKPTTKLVGITSEAEKYLASRKISKATMDIYKIGCDEKGNIIFPYSENSEVVFVKFRPSHKILKGESKAWRENDTKPVLFGMDLCNNEEPLCIFEGEIDAMSGYEAGIQNCVSVPSGAEDLTWLDTCWDWLKQFKMIYLFGDNDTAGQGMIKKLVARLEDYRVFMVAHDFKDCNELLYRNGKIAVLEAYNNAKEIPVNGLLNLADVMPLDVKNLPKTLSGLADLDKKTGGFFDGELSIWTGRRGEGKSTLLGLMMIEAVNQNRKVCVYSGELRADRFQYWINLQAAGRNHIDSYYDKLTDKEIKFVSKENLEKIKKWYSQKFWLYDNSIVKSGEISSILKVFEYAAKRYDCKIFMVDNLMTLKIDTKIDNDYYRIQSNSVARFVDFAKFYNVHVHMVAHPKKTNGKLDNDDVSGSADITGRADNVFSLEILSEKDKAECKFDVALNILKNRDDGAKAKVGLNYDPISRRLYQPSKGNARSYSWEKQEVEDDYIDIGEEP